MPGDTHLRWCLHISVRRKSAPFSRLRGSVARLGTEPPWLGDRGQGAHTVTHPVRGIVAVMWPLHHLLIAL